MQTIHKFDNLDKMDKFLAGHKLPKLTQGEIDNLNVSVSIKEIKFIVRTFQKENTRPRCFLWRILPNIYKRNITNSR